MYRFRVNHVKSAITYPTKDKFFTLSSWSSDFGFHLSEQSVNKLKQKIQYMTYELELTKKEANEEMRKNNEQINKLLHLLQTVIK